MKTVITKLLSLILAGAVVFGAAALTGCASPGMVDASSSQSMNPPSLP